MNSLCSHLEWDIHGGEDLGDEGRKGKAASWVLYCGGLHHEVVDDRGNINMLEVQNGIDDVSISLVRALQLVKGIRLKVKILYIRT